MAIRRRTAKSEETENGSSLFRMLLAANYYEPMYFSNSETMSGKPFSMNVS
jgi:hypothetical protein